MPIFELGYRPWDGQARGPLRRWLEITRTGVTLAVRSRLLRRLLFAAWLPLFYFGPLFFAVGYLTDPTSRLDLRGWSAMIEGLLGDAVARGLRENPESLRPMVWAAAFFYLFAYAQTFLVLIVTAIVGAPLISQDFRSKAFLLYFAKPITRLEYLLGKGGVVLAFQFAIGLLPALVLYSVSILVSPSATTFLQTWTILPRIAAASLVIALPITLLILFLSSLAGYDRFAIFSWFAICVLGEVAYRAVSATREFHGASWTSLLSLRETTVLAVHWIYDVRGELERLGGAVRLDPELRRLDLGGSPEGALCFLLVLSVLCFLGLMRRISAPMRV